MGNCVICWGCECGVPVRDGMHVESTDIHDTEYAYPCKAIPVEASTADPWPDEPGDAPGEEPAK